MPIVKPTPKDNNKKTNISKSQPGIIKISVIYNVFENLQIHQI